MTAAIIIGIIIFLVYATKSQKRQPQLKTVYTNPDDKQTSKTEMQSESDQNPLNNIETIVTNSGTLSYDDSIIDVTNKPIEYIDSIKQEGTILPYYWKNKTIYSYNDILTANTAQKDFYAVFKQSFLRNVYINLNGNTNYLYILLFDFLTEFDNGNNINKLEILINRLGLFYPEIKSYALTCLSNKKAAYSAISNTNRYNDFNYDYWKLGSKYKTKLNLNDDEVNLLNKIWYPSNNFCSVEYCCIEVLKLYISVVTGLKANYIAEGTTIDAQFLAVSDIIARKHFKYKNGSYNYKYCIETTTNEFYSHIFKHCENAVREFYGHKRKINTDTYYTTAEAKTEFENKIISKVSDLLSVLISKVNPPDEATDIELYAQSTNRWKIKFAEITTAYIGNPKEFTISIITLGNLNKKNPSIENIFFEASKFIAKYDKESALFLYIHYLYHDLKSATFDNKQLTKTIQKSLFKTNEQLHEFEIIVSELIKDKDLNKALKEVGKIYETKRKKIRLDTASIMEVQQQHAGTVELLNEYLKDEFEDESNSIKSQEINSEEIKIEITPKSEDVSPSAFVSNLAFSTIHVLTLEFFAKNNFSVPQIELEAFAKSKGVFKNQLIESINETCYDYLDDVLIEEDDDYYTINTNYFQRISAK